MGLLTFASDAAENDYDVATQLGHDYMPALGLHPRAKVPTQGNTNTIPRNSYKAGITTARDTDFLNPAQLYPTTGPGDIAPNAASDFKGYRKGALQ